VRRIEQLLVQPNGYVIMVDGELYTTGSMTGLP
jgi:hypothetical protein